MTLVSRKVPFLDLRVEEIERKEILEAISRVLEHGRFIIGPEVIAFEREIAAFCGKKFAVGTGSGTDALFLALKALKLQPGDEVITTSLSWIATTNAIVLSGATPVFADIAEDLNIDPESVEKLVTSNTKAIVPVHYTGKVCDMEKIQKIADKYNLQVVEDASQAFSATFQGKVAGSFGNLSAFSLNPMKIFAACGEAGIVLTDDEEQYQFLTALRYNGTVNKEHCIATSLNCRLDTIQAAILLERLRKVDTIVARRREIAAAYRQALSSLARTPWEKPFERDVYYSYQIQTPQRDQLKQYLEQKGIEVKIQHPILMCDQSIYQKFLQAPPIRAEKIVQEILCLPVHEKLTEDEVGYVIESVKEFFHG